MRYKNTGSTLLVIILVTSVLSLCVIIVWQSGSLFQDISFQRLLYEQKYRATLSGLNYAIDICAKNFDIFVQNKYKNKNNTDFVFEIETEPLHITKHRIYRCKIYIKPDVTILHLKSKLLDNQNETIFAITCNVCKAKGKEKEKSCIKEQKKLLVKNWKICDL